MRDAGRKEYQARWIASTQPDAVRAGNADRDAVGEELKIHHAAGRLTDDEFQQRLEASMSARTFGELRALTADLPREPLHPTRGWRNGWPHRRRFGPPLLPLLVVLALLWAFVARHVGYGYGWHPHGGPGSGAYAGYYGHPHFPWGLLIVVGAVWFARARLRHARTWAMREPWLDPHGERWARWV